MNTHSRATLQGMNDVVRFHIEINICAMIYGMNITFMSIKMLYPRHVARDEYDIHCLVKITCCHNLIEDLIKNENEQATKSKASKPPPSYLLVTASAIPVTPSGVRNCAILVKHIETNNRLVLLIHSFSFHGKFSHEWKR